MHLKEKLQAVDPNAQALKDEPLLSHVESYYFKIFSDLSRSRQVGMGVGAISISQIYAYCEMFGIKSISERADLLYLIGELDEEFIKYCNEKQK